jgi:PAS domain S-box-containing protein
MDCAVEDVPEVIAKVLCALQGGPGTSVLVQTVDGGKFDYLQRLFSSLDGSKTQLVETVDREAVRRVIQSATCDLIVIDEAFGIPLEELRRIRKETRTPILYISQETAPELLDSGMVNASWSDERSLRRAARRSVRNALSWALSHKIAYERLLSTILSNFINLDRVNLDAGIEEALSAIGKFFRVDRVYIWRFTAEGTAMQKSYTWKRAGIRYRFELGEEIPVSLYSWVVENIKAKKILNLPSISALPMEAHSERRVFNSVNTVSFLAVPLISGGVVEGFLGLSSVREERDWSSDTISLVKIVARVFVSVLEKQRAEFALTTSEKKFGGVVEHLGDGLIICDAALNVIYANSKFLKICSKSLEDIVGKPINEIIGNEPVSALKRYIASPNYKSSQTFAHRCEFPSDSKEKTGSKEKTVLEMRSTLLDRGPKLLNQFIITFADITRTQEMEHQLHHSQKMEAVGRLAGGVAHDFNNLLTAVLGYSGLLLSRIPEGSPYRNELLQIRKASEQAGSLVEQLLTFSRKQVLIPKILNLNNVVEDTSRMLKRLIGEDITLRIDLNEDLSNIRVDPSQMQQIILNLAINARDAMPQGGLLHISTEMISLNEPSETLVAGDYVKMTVTDTGCGIDDYVKQHVFEPFFTTKEQGKGTGLGLSTVYGAVKQSGGEITVESEIGVGTIFQILLPAINEPAAEIRSGLEPEKVAGGSETILLVEDETSVRRLLREVLEQKGYRVLEALNGRDALEVSARFQSRIDLMITDVVMPEMSGHEAAERLGTERPEMKLLIISGYLRGNRVAAQLRSREYTFLQKPFSPADFARIVREILDSKSGSLPFFLQGSEQVETEAS